MLNCPSCNGYVDSTNGTRTADIPIPWYDENEKRWYQGPAIETYDLVCADCGWTKHILRKRGKLVDPSCQE